MTRNLGSEIRPEIDLSQIDAEWTALDEKEARTLREIRVERGRLLTVARRTPTRVRRLMLVGHNPGFEELAKDLVGTSDKTAAERLDKKYPTSGLAVLTWKKGSGSVDAWAKLTPRSAHLQAFVAPRYLD